MFLSGADQQQAELRHTGVKGALRFWWRALQNPISIEKLKKKEDPLMGSTESQAQAQIYLSDVNSSIETQRKWNVNQWESYVGYGLVESTNSNSRNYVEPGTTFTLNVISKGDEKDDLRQAIIALGSFGGLGGRSRKGWGSVVLTELDGWERPDTKDSFAKFSNDFVSALSKDENYPEYTAFSSNSRIVCGEVYNSATQAHKAISTNYKEFVKTVNPKLYREEFGLPRKIKGLRTAAKRRASPLLFHIHVFSDGKAMPVCCFLPANFLVDKALPEASYSEINDFLNQVPL